MNCYRVTYNAINNQAEVIFQVTEPDRLETLSIMFSSFAYYYFDQKRKFKAEELRRSIVGSLGRKNLSIRKSIFKACLDAQDRLEISYLGKASTFNIE